MAEELFKKKISKEEKLYIEAVKLQEAVSCVLRFERKVAALKSAAKKFECLGDYKDAKRRMEVCRRDAAAINQEGAHETYQKALRKKEAAGTKGEYADAIAEFKRVVKRDEYRENAREQIRLCKKEIVRLESIAAWKRRLAVLGIFVVCIVLFMQTPGYPFAKGVVHQQMGEYRLAIANYQEAKGIPWTKDLKSTCYYKLAMEKLEQGKKKEAYRLLKKATRMKAARRQLKELEKELDKDVGQTK